MGTKQPLTAAGGSCLGILLGGLLGGFVGEVIGMREHDYLGALAMVICVLVGGATGAAIGVWAGKPERGQRP